MCHAATPCVTLHAVTPCNVERSKATCHAAMCTATPRHAATPRVTSHATGSRALRVARVLEPESNSSGTCSFKSDANALRPSACNHDTGHAAANETAGGRQHSAGMRRAAAARAHTRCPDGPRVPGVRCACCVLFAARPTQLRACWRTCVQIGSSCTAVTAAFTDADRSSTLARRHPVQPQSDNRVTRDSVGYLLVLLHCLATIEASVGGPAAQHASMVACVGARTFLEHPFGLGIVLQSRHHLQSMHPSLAARTHA
jgi:hypothetical protein